MFSHTLFQNKLFRGIHIVLLWLMLVIIMPIHAQEESDLMTLTVDGVEIHYTTRGEGTPVLILHGFPLDHAVMVGAYEPIFAEREGYLRIYPDMPGMGQSPASDSVQTSDEMLHIMTRFIQEVAPDQKVLVIGFSYGAYIAQGMVLKNPDMVDGLMLMAPVTAPDDADRDIPEPRVIAKDEEAIAMLPEGLAPVILSTTAVQTKPVIERILNEYASAFAGGDGEFLATFRQPENYSFSFDVRQSDGSYDKPVLIITGRQDTIVGFAGGYQVSRLYPRATYAVLDRAGHGLYLEQDALFKALVHEWLDRVEEAMMMQ